MRVDIEYPEELDVELDGRGQDAEGGEDSPEEGERQEEMAEKDLIASI